MKGCCWKKKKMKQLVKEKYRAQRRYRCWVELNRCTRWVSLHQNFQTVTESGRRIWCVVITVVQRTLEKRLCRENTNLCWVSLPSRLRLPCFYRYRFFAPRMELRIEKSRNWRSELLVWLFICLCVGTCVLVGIDVAFCGNIQNDKRQKRCRCTTKTHQKLYS